MIQYPAGLPAPTREGYGLQHGEPMSRTPLSSGRARQRRRFTSVPSEVTLNFVMTDSEAQLFEGWYRWVVQDGSDWVQIEVKTPLGYEQYEGRFTGMYTGPELFGVNLWQFTCPFELKERQTINRQLTEDFPDLVLGFGIIDNAVNNLWPEA